jgi:hypothetical protein
MDGTIAFGDGTPPAGFSELGLSITATVIRSQQPGHGNLTSHEAAGSSGLTTNAAVGLLCPASAHLLLRLVGSAKKADNNEYVFRSRYDAFLTPGYLLVGCGMVSYSKR